MSRSGNEAGRLPVLFTEGQRDFNLPHIRYYSLETIMNRVIQNSIIKSLRMGSWVIGLLLAAGCSDLAMENEEADLTLLEKGVNFKVWETHDQSHHMNASVEPYIRLDMKTEEIYPCLNYRLVSELSQKTSGFDIDIYGVDESGVCLTALGPATNGFPLEASPGEYTLTFNHWGDSYRYQLTVTDSALKVKQSSPSFVEPQMNLFWRYPENSFTYLCRSVPENRWMCEEFEQMLTDSLEIDSFTFPDFGTQPYPSDEEHYDIARYYHFPEESVFLEAGQMLESYADSVLTEEDEALLSVISWKNQGFRSWTDVGE